MTPKGVARASLAHCSHIVRGCTPLVAPPPGSRIGNPPAPAAFGSGPRTGVSAQPSLGPWPRPCSASKWLSGARGSHPAPASWGRRRNAMGRRNARMCTDRAHGCQAGEREMTSSCKRLATSAIANLLMTCLATGTHADYVRFINENTRIKKRRSHMKKPREIIIEKWCVRSGIPNILKIVNSAVQALNPLNSKTAV